MRQVGEQPGALGRVVRGEAGPAGASQRPPRARSRVAHGRSASASGRASAAGVSTTTTTSAYGASGSPCSREPRAGLVGGREVQRPGARRSRAGRPAAPGCGSWTGDDRRRAAAPPAAAAPTSAPRCRARAPGRRTAGRATRCGQRGERLLQSARPPSARCGRRWAPRRGQAAVELHHGPRAVGHRRGRHRGERGPQRGRALEHVVRQRRARRRAARPPRPGRRAARRAPRTPRARRRCAGRAGWRRRSAGAASGRAGRRPC